MLGFQAKVLLIKIYYQADYFDALDALLDSFRIYLGRKTKIITPERRDNYRNLIRLTKQLMNLAPTEAAVNKLKKAIKNTQPLTERDWLLEQL